MSPAQMKLQYKRGASLGDIAGKAKICVATVRKTLVKQKIKIRSAGRPKNDK